MVCLTKRRRKERRNINSNRTRHCLHETATRTVIQPLGKIQVNPFCFFPPNAREHDTTTTPKMWSKQMEKDEERKRHHHRCQLPPLVLFFFVALTAFYYSRTNVLKTLTLRLCIDVLMSPCPQDSKIEKSTLVYDLRYGCARFALHVQYRWEWLALDECEKHS